MIITAANAAEKAPKVDGPSVRAINTCVKNKQAAPPAWESHKTEMLSSADRKEYSPKNEGNSGLKVIA
jgi:hypothetical protein